MTMQALDRFPPSLSPLGSADGAVKRRSPTLILLVRGLIALAAIAILVQALMIVEAKPTDLITGLSGMADLIRRGSPPDVSLLSDELLPALQSVDIALIGTLTGVILAVPLGVLAAHNTTPAKPLYYLARGIIAFARAVPDLVWALLFVAAVGLGPFPGTLAQGVHSIGMLGRLFAEVIEDMDMGPVEALKLTGASRLQIFTQAVVPGVLPSLVGIALYRFDENLRNSMVLGFVGAGGLGFRLLTAMSLFQYREVSLLLLITFALVMAMERISAALRKRLA